MNQRKDSSTNRPVVIAAVVVLALVAAAVYWFAIRDDSDDTKSPVTPSTQTFKKPGLPFTFTYPGNFKETTGPAGFVWIAGVGPYDILNVKRLANQPTALGRLRKTNKEALSARPDLQIVGEGSDVRDGVDMVTFEVTSTVENLALRSQLYFFSLGGVTWQFECESQAKRPEIDAACTQALSSFAAVS